MSDKKRVDVALVERGLAQSREKAQALVMSGVVYIGENKVDKASTQVTPEDELIVRQTGTGYVSRGALKLEKGLAVFGVEAKESVAMDLGASTGGFTDVLLQNGALTVIVASSDMTAEASAAILSLCTAHTDIGVENIRIMAREEP